MGWRARWSSSAPTLEIRYNNILDSHGPRHPGRCWALLLECGALGEGAPGWLLWMMHGGNFEE